ncbi:hypothetical protein [Flavobacterium seoulense]|uniref:Uncharacterized protein n=1 Tax=Flavobacterium seoulense TaxID=1492738 RepID=A0A066WX14_9FLAO|nr:hypothetical protein [Flavobacterium seoulense]KDN55479.1 hypothetical protein FEM21_13620 [Flavobacterium seoulense]
MENRYDKSQQNNRAEESKGLRNTEYNEIESDNKYEDALKDIDEANESFELNSEEQNQPDREIENPKEKERDKENDKDRSLDEHPQKDQRIERQNPSGDDQK